MEQWKTPVILILAALCLWLWFEPARSVADFREVVQTENAPAAIGPYSQAVRAGNTLYFSGQIGLDPASGEMAGAGIAAQARQALQNLKAVGEAAGYRFTDVVEVEVFLTDITHYGTFNEIYSEYFPENKPARAVVEVSGLPAGALVEIRMTATRARAGEGQ